MRLKALSVFTARGVLANHAYELRRNTLFHDVGEALGDVGSAATGNPVHGRGLCKQPTMAPHVPTLKLGARSLRDRSAAYVLLYLLSSLCLPALASSVAISSGGMAKQPPGSLATLAR